MLEGHSCAVVNVEAQMVAGVLSEIARKEIKGPVLRIFASVSEEAQVRSLAFVAAWLSAAAGTRVIDGWDFGKSRKICGLGRGC